jgi:hypothetical protein
MLYSGAIKTRLRLDRSVLSNMPPDILRHRVVEVLRGPVCC